MKPKGLWTGIAKHGAGYRATVSQGRGRPLIQQHFPRGTDPREMQAWRKDTQAALRVTRKQRATRGMFEADAKRYLALKQVQAKPTYQERVRHIQFWIACFGQQYRDTITTMQITEVVSELVTAPRGFTKEGKPLPPLAASTINHRIRALSNLFTVLDGRHLPNPVRDVPEVGEPQPRPRGRDYATLKKILAAMPDRGLGARGQTRPTVSRSKIRLACLMYCQLTPKQLGQLTPDDLDLERGLITLPARTKGKGADALVSPLLPEAVEAFKAFVAHKLFGKFSVGVLRIALQRAAKRVGVTDIRTYDLRHSWATRAYTLTGNLGLVGTLLQHREKSTTQRYALSAEGDVLAGTMTTLAAGWLNKLAQPTETEGANVGHSGTSRQPSSAKVSAKPSAKGAKY